jgi:hypothetical protein
VARDHAGRDPGPFPHLDPFTGLMGRFDGILRDAKKQPGKDGPKGGEETPKGKVKATEADAARATKKATPAQVKEINDLLARARKHFNSLTSEKVMEAGIKAAQRAVDLAVKYYGIDTTHASRVVFTWGDARSGGEVGADRVVHIHTPALTDASFLAATLVHEVTHANQVKLHGANDGTDQKVRAANHHAREVMGYQAALSSADLIGLGAERKKWYAEKVETYRAFLGKENTKLFDSGQYWDMKAPAPDE